MNRSNKTTRRFTIAFALAALAIIPAFSDAQLSAHISIWQLKPNGASAESPRSPRFSITVDNETAGVERTYPGVYIFETSYSTRDGATLQKTREIVVVGSNSAAAGCALNCAELDKVCICLEGTGVCGCGTLSWLGAPVPTTGDDIDIGHVSWIQLQSVLKDESGNVVARDAIEFDLNDESATADADWYIKIGDIEGTSDADGTRQMQPELEVGIEQETAAVQVSYPGVYIQEVSYSTRDGEQLKNERAILIVDPPEAAAGGCSTNCAELGQVCICLEGTGLCGCGNLQWLAPAIPQQEATDNEHIGWVIVEAKVLDSAGNELARDRKELFLGDDEEPVDDTTRPFRRGDANMSGDVDMGDQIFLLAFLFQGGPAPHCDDAADTNDDGNVDIGDAVAGLAWLFQGAAEPPFPGPYRCAGDPTSDELGCAGYRVCEL